MRNIGELVILDIQCRGNYGQPKKSNGQIQLANKKIEKERKEKTTNIKVTFLSPNARKDERNQYLLAPE